MSATLYLRAADAAALYNALAGASLAHEVVGIDGRPRWAAAAGVTLQTVGDVYAPTGRMVEHGDGRVMPEVAAVPGWHAIMLAPGITAEQRGALGAVLIDKPDYPLPSFAGVVEPAAPDLVALRSELIRRIDGDVDAIYGQVVGQRGPEYERAEAQAQGYADEGYPAKVPAMVASWAAAKGWTGRQAALDILGQASAWRGAQETLRAQRLLRKEQARQAVTTGALTAVAMTWDGFIAAVRQQLGV